MKYEVNFTDYKTGATSVINTIVTREGYTADQYIKECRENADDKWNEMLDNGKITLTKIEETPTIKEIVESTGMTQTAFAKHFGMPLRTVQNWCQGKRKCPEYIRNLLVYMIESEKKEEKIIKVQFEAGEGINCLFGKNKEIIIYAECEVPDRCSEDYGYITMKEAILRKLTEEEKKVVSFWYDGQEKFLADDARAGQNVYVEIVRSPNPLIEKYKK